MNLNEKYLKLYKKGLPHLDHWLRPVEEKIKLFQPVCITGIPGIGLGRTLDYLAFKMTRYEEFKNFNLIYSSNITDSLQDLTISLSNKKPNVFIIQKYILRTERFKKDFSYYIQSNKYSCASIISVDPNIYNKKSDITHGQTTLMSNIVIAKPLNFTHTKSLIESRLFMDNFTIDSKMYPEIHRLSGGHGGFIKHILHFLDMGKTLDTNELKIYPPIKVLCKNIVKGFKGTDESIYKKFGLISQLGELALPLLGQLITLEKDKMIMKLTKRQKKLFNKFIQNENDTLSKETVEDILTSPDNYSLWGFYKSISRFRKAIEPNFELVNVYGRGYYIRKR